MFLKVNFPVSFSPAKDGKVSKYLQGFLSTAVAVLVFSTSQSAALAQVPVQSKEVSTVLQVKNMCCGKESGPAIKELSKVTGVSKVIADHKAKTLTIHASNVHALSPSALWVAAERANVVPVKLTVGQKVYTTKPLPQ